MLLGDSEEIRSINFCSTVTVEEVNPRICYVVLMNIRDVIGIQCIYMVRYKNSSSLNKMETYG